MWEQELGGDEEVGVGGVKRSGRGEYDQNTLCDNPQELIKP